MLNPYVNAKKVRAAFVGTSILTLFALAIAMAGCTRRSPTPPPPPPPVGDPQKAASAAADAHAAAEALAKQADNLNQQTDKLKALIDKSAQTVESARQLAENSAVIAGATKSANDARSAANDAQKTAADVRSATADALASLQQQSDQLRQERTRAEQAAKDRINTALPGKRKSLADYVPCRFIDSDEVGFRLGYTDGGAVPETAAGLTQTARDNSPNNVRGFLKLRLENPSLSPAEFADLAIARQIIVDPARKPAVVSALTAAAKSNASAQGDVGCSQSMLSWKETDLIFGRAVANNYVAIEVNARNLNDTEEFLLHDVQVAVADVNSQGQLICPSGEIAATNPNAKSNDCLSPTHFVSGRDKLLARAVLVSGRSESPRNVAANIIDIAGSVLSATSGVLGTTVLNSAGTSVSSSGRMNLSNFVHVFSAVAMPGFNKLFPDYTVDQLNRLNDMGFSANTAYKILIPKGGSVPLVTFLSAKIFADSYKTWNAQQLRTFQENMVVVVSGKHIVEANDEIQVSAIDCPKTSPGGYLDLSKADGDSFSCDIKGDNLAKAGSVQLQNSAGSDPKTADGKVTVSGSSSKAVFSVAALKALTGSNYTLFVPDSSGKLTSTTIHVSLPPVVASVDPVSLALSGTGACTTANCPITLKGTNLDLIGKVVLKAKDSDPTTSALSGVLGSTNNGTRTASFPLTGLSALTAQTDPYRLQVITTDGAEILPTVPFKITK